MLLVDSNDTFKVTVIYKKEGSRIFFLDMMPDKGIEGVSTDWFEFRRPNWSDVQLIMSRATNGGRLSIENMDAMAFVDAKVRVLLKSWSLVDSNDKPLPLEKVDKLPTSVIMRLGFEIDKELGPNGLFGNEP